MQPQITIMEEAPGLRALEGRDRLRVTNLSAASNCAARVAYSGSSSSSVRCFLFVALCGASPPPLLGASRPVVTAGTGRLLSVASDESISLQNLPGGQVYFALDRGTIDAADWVSPYDDEILKLHEAAKYYYMPSWAEPGATLTAY